MNYRKALYAFGIVAVLLVQACGDAGEDDSNSSSSTSNTSSSSTSNSSNSMASADWTLQFQGICEGESACRRVMAKNSTLPFDVLVLDEADSPVEGAEIAVSFARPSPGFELADVSSTGSDGIASGLLGSGGASGIAPLEVSLPGASEAQLMMTVYVNNEPDKLTHRAECAGQIACAVDVSFNSEVSLSVRFLDVLGEPVRHESIGFSIEAREAEGSELSVPLTTTDSDGVAAVTFISANTQGVAEIEVDAGDVEPIKFVVAVSP